MVDGAPMGMAASSFTAVSVSPPLVSVCVRRESQTWPFLRHCDYFGISIHATGQELVWRSAQASGSGDADQTSRLLKCGTGRGQIAHDQHCRRRARDSEITRLAAPAAHPTPARANGQQKSPPAATLSRCGAALSGLRRSRDRWPLGLHRTQLTDRRGPGSGRRMQDVRRHRCFVHVRPGRPVDNKSTKRHPHHLKHPGSQLGSRVQPHAVLRCDRRRAQAGNACWRNGGA